LTQILYILQRNVYIATHLRYGCTGRVDRAPVPGPYPSGPDVRAVCTGLKLY